jgi:hypothetical protein
MERLSWRVDKAECERLAALLGGQVTSLGDGWMVVSFLPGKGLPIRRKKQGWGEMRLYLEKLCDGRRIDRGD